MRVVRRKTWCECGRNDEKEMIYLILHVRETAVEELDTDTRRRREMGEMDVARWNSSTWHNPFVHFGPLYDCRGEGQ